MQAAQIVAPGRATVIDAAVPEPGPDDVLIRVCAAGICGTDVHIYKGEYEAHYPLVPGHEFSGEVAAVGANVTNFRVGDRVTADPNVPCSRCANCQRNEPNQCRNLQAIGVTRSGAFAEYVVAPEGNTFSIGDMPYDTAALIEPLACVVWGLQRVQVQAGDTVLLFGAGPMGCLLTQALAHAGASRLVVVDTVSWRLDLAAELGATDTVLAKDGVSATLNAIEPSGFNVVVDATGVPAVIRDLPLYARSRGKVWIFGVAPRGTRVDYDPYEVFRRDLSIIGSFAVNRTFPQAIALLRAGVVKAQPLISHRLALSEFAAGLDIAQNDPRRIKVQFALE